MLLYLYIVLVLDLSDFNWFLGGFGFGFGFSFGFGFDFCLHALIFFQVKHEFIQNVSLAKWRKDEINDIL